jgi:hypothetical protein
VDKQIVYCGPKVKKLDGKRAMTFHTFVMKRMFLCKRARQDIQPGIAFLATRTGEPNEGDWAKSIKILVFLKATQDKVTSMKADDTQTNGMSMLHLQFIRITRVIRGLR